MSVVHFSEKVFHLRGILGFCGFFFSAAAASTLTVIKNLLIPVSLANTTHILTCEFNHARLNREHEPSISFCF